MSKRITLGWEPLGILAENLASMKSPYSRSSSERWAKVKAVALAARRHADDHSAVVLTRLVASETPKLLFALPTRVSPSVLIAVGWRGERKWSKSRTSPPKIHSHCAEGIPGRARRESLTRDLNPSFRQV